MKKSSYEAAGVSISSGEAVTEKIKNYARSTFSGQVLHGIGLFSGFFSLDIQKYRQPVIVTSIDGVGTKVKIAKMHQTYHSVGQDLVNHCVNDIAVCGADPIFFTDYFATDRLEANIVCELVKGISIACKQAGCALIGGETAEMPGVYVPGSFDLAGSITGIVEKNEIISGQHIESGDVLLGLESNGIHTNGYSLVRKVFFADNNYRIDSYLPETNSTLGEELLRVHRSYLPVIRSLRKNAGVKGIAHITGGGIEGNTKRLLNQSFSLQIDWKSWQIPPIFNIIQNIGKITIEEMRQVFNLGIGLVLIVAENEIDKIKRVCMSNNQQAWIIGTVIKNNQDTGTVQAWSSC